MRLTQLVQASVLDCAAVAAYLDGLDHAARVAETRALPRAGLCRLYEAVKGFYAVSLAGLVPTAAPAHKA